MEVLEVTPNELFTGSNYVVRSGIETPLARNIGRLRESLDLSAKDFGDKLGINEEIVYQLETGELRPKKELFDNILRKFNITSEELAKNDGIYLATSERRVLQLYKNKSIIEEHAHSIEDCYDTQYMPLLDNETGEIKDRVITPNMQAKEFVKNKINLDDKTLKQLIDIYHYICDEEIKKISKEI